METWQIILVVTIGLIAVFLLMGLFGYSKVTKYESMLIQELEALNDYEIERGKKILVTLSALEKVGYKKDEETYKIISNGVENMAELNMDQRNKYKNMVDMFSYILGRIHFEDKRFGKYISEEDANEFKDYHLDADQKYEKYNKAAIRYNVYLSAIFTKFILFIKGEKKVTAIVF